MKIQFTADTVLSYDGLNTRTYLKGQVYEPYHAQEKRVFERALKDGSAIPFGADEKPVETKVAPPTQTKAKTTKKAK